MYRGEFVPEHPKFPEGSEAVAKLADGPVPMNTPKIKYTKEDDKAIEEYVKQYSESLIWKSDPYFCILTNFLVGTTWHSVCGSFPHFRSFWSILFVVWHLCHESSRPGWCCGWASECLRCREPEGCRCEVLFQHMFQYLADIVDLSIVPENVSANTYSTTITIGEKAAVLIAQDLGITGVTESDWPLPLIVVRLIELFDTWGRRVTSHTLPEIVWARH